MKILIVDDDIKLRELVEFVPRQAGYLVLTATDGAEALAVFEQEQPDLLILEVDLPVLSGLEVCERIRRVATKRIMMLTVRTSEEDQVRALDMGANDYLTKPFSPRTLLARIRALLRRMDRDHHMSPQARGKVMLDPERQTVQIGGGTTIRLTNLEFRLLLYMVIHEGHTIPTERLITHLWGYRGLDDRHVLKQLIHRLRHKIEDRPADPQHLVTVSGIGYRLKLGDT